MLIVQNPESRIQIARSEDFKYNLSMPIRDVTDLKIYQRAMDLLPETYQVTRSIPERELQPQIQRAARSIAANITEGFGRKSTKREFKRFLSMALGSSDEVQTHLRQVQVIYGVELDDLISSCKELSRQINHTVNVWS